jgi:cell division septum initiation protein DivIVA
VAKPEDAARGPVVVRPAGAGPGEVAPAPAERTEPDAPEDLIDRLIEAVRGARSMPLSSSALVNRQELLDLLERLRRALPAEIARARSILRDGEEVLERAGQEAQRLLERARQERERLLQKTEIVQAAAREADRLVAEAEAAAKRIRAEAESYVESKLATFEVVLQKTLQAVERGRQRLAGRLEADELAPEEPEPER